MALYGSCYWQLSHAPLLSAGGTWGGSVHCLINWASGKVLGVQPVPDGSNLGGVMRVQCQPQQMGASESWTRWKLTPTCAHERVMRQTHA